MATVQELIAQKVALEKEIAEAQRQAKADGIAKVHALMAEHGLTVADISGPSSTGKSKTGSKPGKTTTGRKVAAKYRDPVSGTTWTGRGVAPKWIAGKDRESFLIKS